MSESSAVATPATESPPNMLGQIETDERTWWHRNREAFSLRSAGAVYALIILVSFFTVRAAQIGRPNYLSSANVGNVLEQSSLIAIMAVGMTVLLISGNFDLSVASNAAMSSMAAAMVVDPLGPFGAILFGLGVGTVGGLINGLVHWYVGVNSFIVTLGTLTAFRGMVLFMNDSQEKLITPEQHDTLEAWAGGFIGSIEVALVATIGLALATLIVFRNDQQWLAIGLAGATVVAAGLTAFTDYAVRIAHNTFFLAILLLAVWFVLKYTVTGRRLYATGGNIEAARAAGIVVARYRIVPFVLVGFCAGMAGVINLSRVGAVSPTLLQARELDVIASAIIGGVALTGGSGNVLKTVVGSILLFVMTNGFTIIGLSPVIAEIAIGVLVVVSASLYVVAARRAAAAGKV